MYTYQISIFIIFFLSSLIDINTFGDADAKSSHLSFSDVWKILLGVKCVAIPVLLGIKFPVHVIDVYNPLSSAHSIFTYRRQRIESTSTSKKMFDFYFATNIEKRKEREQEQGESRMTPKKTKRKDATMRWTMAKTAIKHKPQQHWWKLQ